MDQFGGELKLGSGSRQAANLEGSLCGEQRVKRIS